MHRYETIDLGTYRGEEYFLVGFVEPEPTASYDPDEDADRYGVSVVRSRGSPLEENVEIVRMDDTHGKPHLDREYLPSDTDRNRKIWLVDGYSYRRMRRYLLANWERFAEQYTEYNE